jgi:hypothetical protein
MRLPRPYIPLKIKIQVAERQASESVLWRDAIMPLGIKWTLRQRLTSALTFLFGSLPVELHHRPALCNRPCSGAGVYEPDANDPDYLVYVPKDEHDIETRVRGQHGDYSDLAKARKRKRKERKAKRRKTHWPSRPLRSANRWPKKGKLK